MKFTYDTPETETLECVAYISQQGNIILKSTGDGNIAICKDGEVHAQAVWITSEATRKFYRGDSITITF